MRSRLALYAALIVGLVEVFVSFAAEPAAKSIRVTVQVAQKKLLVLDDGARYAIDLSKLTEAHELNQAKLLFANVMGAHRYLLVYVGGPSRPVEAATKYCGAGTEASLMWLMLDSRWRLLRSQAALIESCFESAEGSYEVKNAQATAQWVNFRLMKNFSMRYSAVQPAAGMSVVEQPLDAK